MRAADPDSGAIHARVAIHSLITGRFVPGTIQRVVPVAHFDLAAVRQSDRALVSAYLRARGVVVEKTGYYCIFVLVSIAVTRGKSGTLLAELFDFHRAYETNTPVITALPEIAAAFPDRYEGLGLRDLAA